MNNHWMVLYKTVFFFLSIDKSRWPSPQDKFNIGLYFEIFFNYSYLKQLSNLTANFERTTNDIQNKQMEIFYIFCSLWDKTFAPYKCSSYWQDVSRYMLAALCHSFWGMSYVRVMSFGLIYSMFTCINILSY
jgi:hypothetical protein